MKTSHLADIITRLRNSQIRNKKEVCLGQIPIFCQRVLDCLVQDGWLTRWYFKENLKRKKNRNLGFFKILF
jgi:ribosomal protein S8